MVFREWHRHRTQSYNEMSARYVPLPNENYCPDRRADLVARAELAASTDEQAGAGQRWPVVHRRWTRT
jgi:thymidylate synthase ThyX